ncbi:MAG TPA: hypothetical protein VLI67_04220, partial [Vicinamibacteria bacterium]|nr:hypothetical protein [Vicinamibacteria bacterium]
ARPAWRDTHAPVPPGEARRADPLALRAFDQPTVLRRLFGRTSASFLGEGTPERRLLALLMEEDRAAAEAAVPEPWSVPEARRLVERVSALVRGEGAFPGFWGEDEVVDRLRLRALARREARPGVAWEGFLAWAGGALTGLAEAPRRDGEGPTSLEEALTRSVEALPEAALPAACAAVASARGYRKALEAVLARLPGEAPGARAGQALRTTAMRLALEGGFLPASLGWLVPGHRGAALDAAGADDLWRPGLLALRGCEEHGHEGGLVHLTAALTAGHFRWGLGRVARRLKLDIAVPRWGDPPLAGDARHSLRTGLRSLRDADLAELWGVSPWPSEWGGPDVPEIGRRIGGLVGGRVDHVALILLHDRLAVAAVWALVGRSQSALAQIAAGTVEPALERAREALRSGIARGTKPGLPAHRPAAPAAETLRALLQSTPDPSVALRTPHWMLERGRGALTNRLIREGRRDEARHLRTVLDRADLRERLAPFWLLRGPADTGSVLALARWLRAHVPLPPERGWVAFMEWQCRLAQRTDA